jgi:hypothetical protein
VGEFFFIELLILSSGCWRDGVGEMLGWSGRREAIITNIDGPEGGLVRGDPSKHKG